MLVGYIRVSTDNDRQSTDLQRDALLVAGVDARNLFQDHASGARDDRPGLAKAAQYERALTRERVVAGLAAAKRRGRRGGRPLAITGEKLDAILAALGSGMSKAAVCRNFEVKRTTLIETLARICWPKVTVAIQE
ncbi:hypothetical protein EAH72_34275 [Pseudomonas caspiana]|nr:recombinase family protein [Pseudomonas caspiana]TPG87739.1 hypothetical protein EAH72_34275 [Pseudomonas caspiana]